MNRRNFIKSILGGAAVVAAPKMVNAAVPEEKPFKDGAYLEESNKISIGERCWHRINGKAFMGPGELLHTIQKVGGTGEVVVECNGEPLLVTTDVATIYVVDLPGPLTIKTTKDADAIVTGIFY